MFGTEPRTFVVPGVNVSKGGANEAPFALALDAARYCLATLKFAPRTAIAVSVEYWILSIVE